MAATSKSKVHGKKRKYLEEEQEVNTELLPKLPNDITVQLICTKLPWQTFHVLSSVSRAWLGTIRSGEINDTRVCSRTAETLAFLQYESFPDTHPRWRRTALYSLRDKAFYRLPNLAPFERGEFPPQSQCITMGGKVYILGGAYNRLVWVLDVAGQKKWQKCASMHTQRENFVCAVFEGKIYVFGGCRTDFPSGQPFDFSEVYDPKVDAWTKISPMKKFWKSNLRAWAGAVRDEILVDAGEVYHRDYSRRLERQWRPIERSKDGMEAYNPAKDSWRTIPPGDFGSEAKRKLTFDYARSEEKLFTAHGRLHSLSPGKISVIDLDEKSVKCLHTCSLITRSDNNRHYLGSFWPDEVLVTNDGLLTKDFFNCFEPPFNKCRLYQSGTVELGIGKKKILLEEVKCPLLANSFVHFSFLQPIEL